jgi:hypothetical protein
MVVLKMYHINIVVYIVSGRKLLVIENAKSRREVFQ